MGEGAGWPRMGGPFVGPFAIGAFAIGPFIGPFIGPLASGGRGCKDWERGEWVELLGDFFGARLGSFLGFSMRWLSEADDKLVSLRWRFRRLMVLRFIFTGRWLLWSL